MSLGDGIRLKDEQPLERLRVMKAQLASKAAQSKGLQLEDDSTGGYSNINDGMLSGIDKTLIYGNVGLVGPDSDKEEAKPESGNKLREI